MRTGARWEVKFSRLGAHPRAANLASDGFVFWNCGGIGYCDIGHCLSHIFSFISKIIIFRMYFEYSWRCSHLPEPKFVGLLDSSLKENIPHIYSAVPLPRLVPS